MFVKSIEPGLELRPYEARFAEQVHAAIEANRQHLTRFMPWAKEQTLDGTRDFMRKSLQRFADNDGFDAGVWLDGNYVGGIGVHSIRWNVKATEIGYWLAAQVQGRGIMTKCARAIINHAFGELKVNRIEIRCDTENARSRAIPLRLGFTDEGTLRQILLSGDGTLRDGVMYSMLASEWKG